MNLRSVDLNLLPVLEAIYVERNLTRAAERVGLSQPAMSNALSRLRGILDDDLFVRQGRTMQPTPKARQVALAVQEALDILRKGLTAQSSFALDENRTFRICGSEHVEYVIAPAMVRILEDHIANIKLHVLKPTPGQELSLLKSGEADLVVDYERPDSSELVSQELYSDQLICLMRQDHPFVGDELTIEDFGNMMHVVPEVAVNRFFLDVYLRSKGVARDVVVRAPSVISMPSVVENSDIVCTMSEIIAEQVAGRAGFRSYSAPLPDTTFPIFMIWHKSRDSDPANIWLRDKVKSIFGELGHGTAGDPG